MAKIYNIFHVKLDKEEYKQIVEFFSMYQLIVITTQF